MHILKTGAAGFMVQLGSSLYQAEFDLHLKNRSNLVSLKKKKKTVVRHTVGIQGENVRGMVCSAIQPK